MSIDSARIIATLLGKPLQMRPPLPGGLQVEWQAGDTVV
jgi:hypothetical protein